MVSTSRAVAAVVAASFALASTFATSTAFATETDDPRATVVPNDNAADCDDAGLEGTVVDTGDLEFTGGKVEDDLLLTITGVAEGLTVTGIVVKGGDAYNIYVPGELELSEDVPWEDLRAPINDGGNQPELSHWYVCATGEVTPPSSTTPPPSSTEPASSTAPPTSTEPTNSTEPSSTTEPSTTTTPGETEPGAPGESEEPTTDAPVDSDEDSDDLAVTGFGAAWLIPIGALLLLGGGAAIWLARARKQQV